MQIHVTFFSHFKDLTGCATAVEELPPGSNIQALLERLCERYSGLSSARGSLLVAVDLEYQTSQYVLHDGDEVALFPPVQGG
jgi:molybdopterin converting factor small subunit